MKRHLRRWGAAWIIAVWFTISWVTQFVAQWAAGDDLIDFVAATAENWQSEALQLLAEAVFFLGPLGAVLFAAGDEERARLKRVERKLDELLARPDPAAVERPDQEAPSP